MSNTMTVPVTVPVLRQGGLSANEYLGQFAITITVDQDREAVEDEPLGDPVAWKSILAVEGELTRDNGPMPRIIPVNTLTWGELPAPFFAMGEIVGPGHDGQVLVGRIDSIARIAVEDFDDEDFDLSRVPEGSQIIFATGVILNNATTAHFLTLMHDRALRGVSIDMVAAEFKIAHADSLEPVEDEFALTMEDIMSGDYVIAVQHAEIGGATAAPMQGIGTATIALVAAAVDQWTIQSSFGVFEACPLDALTAAAPLARRREAYFRPEPDHPCPLTVTEDGEVYGHLFVKGSCHVGFQHECLMPQPSPTDYAHFNLAPVPTLEGEDVLTGPLTMDTDHAVVAPGVTAEQVWRHYSDTGCAVADVRVTNGRFGGWVSGGMRAVPDAVVRTLKAAKMSGDWRKKDGRLDLIGILMVNVPGFEVPQPQVAMVASAAGLETEALVAAGIYTTEDEIADLAAELMDDECAPCEFDALVEELIAA